jgi:hypothetical protein
MTIFTPLTSRSGPATAARVVIENVSRRRFLALGIGAGAFTMLVRTLPLHAAVL